MNLNCKPLARLFKKNQTMPELSSAIPFVVGMSGHRDPSDSSEVKRRCRKEFQSIHDKSRSTPKILLSGMADGADQIAVKVALELGWHVIAVLPMPYKDYLKDFDQAGQAGLSQLLERCIKTIELPLVQAEQVDPDISDARQQQYRNLGIFMIRHSQLMVLCWDGDKRLQASPGGTLEVRNNCEKGVASEGAPKLQPLRTVDTLCVPTARISRPDFIVPKESCCTWLRGKSVKSGQRWKSTLMLMDKFNKSGRSTATHFQDQKKQSESWLLGAEALTPELRKDLGSQLEVYAQADAISISQQTRRNKVVLKIIGVLFLALLAQGVYGGLDMVITYLAIYVVLLFVGWGVYLCSFKVKQLDTSYLDYRALAEGLRVQIFWQLHGVRNCVSKHYLYNCNREIYWISEAISNLRLHRNECEGTDKQSRSLIRQHWIEGQRNYFLGQPSDQSTLKSGKAYAHQLQAEQASKQVKVGFGLGIALTAIALLVHFYNLEGDLFSHAMTAADGWLNVSLNCLLLAATLNFGLSAGAAMYAEIQGHENRAASYFLTGRQFHEALSQYDAAQGDPPRQDAVILDIGKEALAENANWLVSHRKVTQSFINPF